MIFIFERARRAPRIVTLEGGFENGGLRGDGQAL